MVVSNKSMLVVARESLKIAKREYEELGNLFIEDQFRHIVVSELKKKRKRNDIKCFFGQGSKYPKIVLEFMWKKGGKKMDIAILKKSTKGQEKRHRYSKKNPQLLAIELKVNPGTRNSGIKSDLTRMRKMLRTGGESTFEKGMFLYGAKTAYKPRNDYISHKESGFLFGKIDEDGKIKTYWLKNPHKK